MKQLKYGIKNAVQKISGQRCPLHPPPTLAQKAIPQLLVFPSTWECEMDFSAILNTKSKNRNRLTLTFHDFGCAASTVAPLINQIVQKKKKSRRNHYIQ